MLSRAASRCAHGPSVGPRRHRTATRGITITTVLCTGRADPLVDRPVVVGPVRRETPDWILDLVEQIRQGAGVVPAARRELGRHNEPLVIHSDVQLAPVPASLRCLVLVRVPFARTQDLEPRGIDDQVDRAVVGSGQRRQLNDLVPARECGVVRGLEVEAHHPEQRVQETLGLAKRQAVDNPQGQCGQDRQVRVPPPASAKTVLRWCPRGDRLFAQSDRDVAAAPEATLVLPPVPHSVLRLVLAVHSARLPRGHEVAPSISIMDRDPEPELASEPTPIHAAMPRLAAG